LVSGPSGSEGGGGDSSRLAGAPPKALENATGKRVVVVVEMVTTCGADDLSFVVL